MPSEAPRPPFEAGLLSPLTQGPADVGSPADAAVSDDAVLAALVTVEVGLGRAWARVSGSDGGARHVSDAFGWAGAGELCTHPTLDAGEIARAAATGGNPVIPLVAAMRRHLGPGWRVHRGATSQDILDSALMLLARRAAGAVDHDLAAVETALTALATRHRDTVAAARTLTQHAVPTTVGLRVAAWLRGVRRARARLAAAAAQLPAQLGGAGGTRASFLASATAELGSAGRDAAAALPAAFAEELGLDDAGHPWHTERWPVTELGDALVQAIDALGVFASDVTTGARTEIGEWVVSETGGSSAMPQKRNPTAAVLVRSAALRAPQLGATLHLAAATAVDERPDGAWHAEWPVLRELLRLALGAAATARRLAEGLSADTSAVARNLGLTGPLLVAERLSIELTGIIGSDGVQRVVDAGANGSDLAAVLRAELQRASDREGRSAFPTGGVDALLDPAGYLGFAGSLVDAATAEEDE